MIPPRTLLALALASCLLEDRRSKKRLPRRIPPSLFCAPVCVRVRRHRSTDWSDCARSDSGPFLRARAEEWQAASIGSSAVFPPHSRPRYFYTWHFTSKFSVHAGSSRPCALLSAALAFDYSHTPTPPGLHIRRVPHSSRGERPSRAYRRRMRASRSRSVLLALLVAFVAHAEALKVLLFGGRELRARS